MPNPKARPCDEAAIRATGAVAGCPQQSKRWILAVTILASTISYIDESVVNVALPTIEAELKTSAAVVQWLVNAYMLSLTALVLTGGAAGDQFGRRRIFVVGTALFAAASLWCGLSGDIAQLIAARTLQGAGAALLIPCSLAIIGATFDESERGAAIGTWASFSALSAAIGPVLGGWIVDHASWRWIFLINPFIALPAILIALRHVPESRDENAARGLDWRGALLAFAGLGALVYGLIAAPDRGWSDTRVIACAGRRCVAARGLRVRGEPQPRSDDAAGAVPFALLQRRERADLAALCGPRRCVVLPAVPAHPGARLLGDARRRGIPAVHGDHGGAVALGRRPARPLRRAAAAHRRPRDRGSWIRAARAARRHAFLSRDCSRR